MNFERKWRIALAIIAFLIGLIFCLWSLSLKETEKYDKFFVSTLNIIGAVLAGVSLTMVLELIIRKNDSSKISNIIQTLNEIKQNNIILGDRTSEIDVVKIDDDFKKIDFSKIHDDQSFHEINMLFINLREDKISATLKDAVTKFMNSNPLSIMKILIMNPFSEYIFKRGVAIKQISKIDETHNETSKYLTNSFYGFHEVHEFCSEIEASLSCKTVKIDKKMENRVQLQIYEVYPSYTYVSIGFFSWISPLWFYKSSMGGASVSVDLRRNTPLSLTLKENFSKLWDNDSKKLGEINELNIFSKLTIAEYLKIMKGKQKG